MMRSSSLLWMQNSLCHMLSILAPIFKIGSHFVWHRLVQVIMSSLKCMIWRSSLFLYIFFLTLAFSNIDMTVNYEA